MSELEIVASWIGDDPTRVLLEPPFKNRYLNGIALEADGSPVFRTPLQLHSHDIKALHTVCHRTGFVSVQCLDCRSEFSGAEAFDTLMHMHDHQDGTGHSGFRINGLEPGRRQVEAVEFG